MTTRKEVFEAIDRERSYQDDKWGSLDDNNNVADFLCYMRRYLDEAVYKNNPKKRLDALTAIKKLTALGVACMERFATGAER